MSDERLANEIKPGDTIWWADHRCTVNWVEPAHDQYRQVTGVWLHVTVDNGDELPLHYSADESVRVSS